MWVVRFKTGDGAQEVEIQDVIAAAGIRSRRLTKQDCLQLVRRGHRSAGPSSTVISFSLFRFPTDPPLSHILAMPNPKQRTWHLKLGRPRRSRPAAGEPAVGHPNGRPTISTLVVRLLAVYPMPHYRC